jgi:hypothetical protein
LLTSENEDYQLALGGGLMWTRVASINMESLYGVRAGATKGIAGFDRSKSAKKDSG